MTKPSVNVSCFSSTSWSSKLPLQRHPNQQLPGQLGSLGKWHRPLQAVLGTLQWRRHNGGQCLEPRHSRNSEQEVATVCRSEQEVTIFLNRRQKCLHFSRNLGSFSFEVHALLLANDPSKDQATKDTLNPLPGQPNVTVTVCYQAHYLVVPPPFS